MAEKSKVFVGRLVFPEDIIERNKVGITRLDYLYTLFSMESLARLDTTDLIGLGYFVANAYGNDYRSLLTYEPPIKKIAVVEDNIVKELGLEQLLQHDKSIFEDTVAKALREREIHQRDIR